ncbi:hypothetical protein ACLOJK_027738 [Asimina triloba]
MAHDKKFISHRLNLAGCTRLPNVANLLIRGSWSSYHRMVKLRCIPQVISAHLRTLIQPITRGSDIFTSSSPCPLPLFDAGRERKKGRRNSGELVRFPPENPPEIPSTDQKITEQRWRWHLRGASLGPSRMLLLLCTPPAAAHALRFHRFTGSFLLLLLCSCGSGGGGLRSSAWLPRKSGLPVALRPNSRL